MSYQHLSLQERYYIETELRKSSSINSIAKALGREQSTVSREIGRNREAEAYRHEEAHRKARARQDEKRKAVKLTLSVREKVRELIEMDWSPEQISGRLKKEKYVSLHHETIYRFILADKKAGGSLYNHLRHQKKYRKRYGTPGNRSGIPGRVDIDKRPAAANNRRRVGDWEADTIVGSRHQGIIVTLDDRKTKLRLAMPLQSRNAEGVKEAVIGLLEPVRQFVRTITFDNGKEFSLHQHIARRLECGTYFSKPYHAWERGQNENANGLLRQYFPKAMNLREVSHSEVGKAVDKLNNRPRKCLDYSTPNEIFTKLTGIDAEELLGYALVM